MSKKNKKFSSEPSDSAKIQNLSIANANLTTANLVNANLTTANLTNANIANTNSEPASLEPADPSVAPAISIIIPMYNVEKYVGECLDSLLAQTFKNFEVIVVDDCSTDSGVAIVEGYTEKFGGRLKLEHTEENSGDSALPRNIGLTHARGEYVYFMDSDDAITTTALEELHGLAKKFDADVVHCEKNYGIPDNRWHDDYYRRNLTPSAWPAAETIHVTEPRFLSEDLTQRGVDFCGNWLTWSVYNLLLRREFLTENKLKFVNSYAEDKVFTICAICSAKKYLVVPNVVYYYRQRGDSISHAPLDKKSFRKDTASLRRGIKYIGEYIRDREPFSKRPDLRYAMYDFFAQEIFPRLEAVYVDVPAPDLDEILQEEFSGEDSIFLAFLFSSMNIFRHNFLYNAGRVAELENNPYRIRY